MKMVVQLLSSPLPEGIDTIFYNLFILNLIPKGEVWGKCSYAVLQIRVYLGNSALTH